MTSKISQFVGVSEVLLFNLTQILYGDRLGKEGKIRLGCSAAILDEQGRILLTRRADNGQWCLPGGGMEPGESAAEACEKGKFWRKQA